MLPLMRPNKAETRVWLLDSVYKPGGFEAVRLRWYGPCRNPTWIDMRFYLRETRAPRSSPGEGKAVFHTPGVRASAFYIYPT